MAKAKKAVVAETVEEASPSEPEAVALTPLTRKEVEEMAQQGKWYGKRADFSGYDLSELDLSGADLRACIFEGAKVTNANLEHCNLSGTKWGNHPDVPTLKLKGADTTYAEGLPKA